MNNQEFSRSSLAAVWNPLYSGQQQISYQGWQQESHMVGDGSIAPYYALPQAVVDRYAQYNTFKFKDDFAFPGMTAPEMALGFMDMVLGPDIHVYDMIDRARRAARGGQLQPDQFVQVVQAYMGHMNVKLQTIQQMRSQLTGLYSPTNSLANLYVINADLRIPDTLDRSLREAIVQNYRQQIEKRYSYIEQRYHRALSNIKKNQANERMSLLIADPQADPQRVMMELSQNADPATMLNSMAGYLNSLRVHMLNLVESERTGQQRSVRDYPDVRALVDEFGPDLEKEISDAAVELSGVIQDGRFDPQFEIHGKRWVPPYQFMRVAENHEAFLLNRADRETYRPPLVYVGTVLHASYLEAARPVADSLLSEQELALVPQVAQVVGGNSLEEVTQNLLNALAQRGDAGLNEYEVNALLAMRTHWDQDLANAGQGNADRVFAHNEYSIGPNLMFKILVNYWNDPVNPLNNNFRAAIYDGAGSALSSASENFRLLQRAPLTHFSQDQSPVHHEPGIHPRRTTPVPCDRGDANRFPDPQTRRCA